MSTNSEVSETLRGVPVGINPYKLALHMMKTRLKWDLNARAWSSRARLKSMRNGCAGRKAVIVCNGPSLLKTDLSLLEGHYCFGLNKINLLFDKSPFRPAAVVALNSLVIEQNAPFFNQTDLPLFISSREASKIRPRGNVTYFNPINIKGFARDCSMSVVEGPTVTYIAMQLAFHMGFSQVALIGCDHNFQAKGPANLAVRSGADDKDHFDPNYFSKGVSWQLPDLVASDFFYELARRYFDAEGRVIYNCTVGGRLEIFPRLPLEEFVRL